MKAKIVNVATGQTAGYGEVSTPSAARQLAQNFIARNNLNSAISPEAAKTAFQDAQWSVEGEIVIPDTPYSVYLRR